jgi:RimJ/RimL family protein N-acetyltransferase
MPWSECARELTVVAKGRSYILEGRPRPEDAAAHRVFVLDQDAARFFGWTVEQAMSQPDSHYDEVIKHFIREWEEGRTFIFTIRDRKSGAPVGSVEIRLSDANVSYVVAPERRGQGLATRAVEALLRWCDDAPALDHVNLTCHAENIASRRVAEKCRFVLVSQEGDELRFRRGCSPA